MKDQRSLSEFPPNFTITDKLAYLDTAWVWIPRYLEQWERDTLEGLCGGAFIYRPAWRTRDFWMWRLGYKVRLVLQQPLRAAFEFLKERIDDLPAPLTNRVDCALDFVTGTPDQARRLQLYFDAHWHKPYHRPRHGVEVFRQTTTYIGFKHWPTKHVSYSDRPSRHVGKPCCHLECRFQTGRAVATLGIKSIDDLLAFNLTAFWRKHLRLYEYDPEDLGKRWSRRHLNSAPRIVKLGPWRRNMDTWTGYVIARMLIDVEDADKPILMDLIVHFARRGLSLSRVLVPVDTTALLSGVRRADI